MVGDADSILDRPKTTTTVARVYATSRVGLMEFSSSPKPKSVSVRSPPIPNTYILDQDSSPSKAVRQCGTTNSKKPHRASDAGPNSAVDVSAAAAGSSFRRPRVAGECLQRAGVHARAEHAAGGRADEGHEQDPVHEVARASALATGEATLLAGCRVSAACCCPPRPPPLAAACLICATRVVVNPSRVAALHRRWWRLISHLRLDPNRRPVVLVKG
jgi:hypothetical protein